VEDRWLGSNARMFWSHADAPTYQSWLRDAGFVVLRRSFVPEGETRHALFLARKPVAGGGAPHASLSPEGLPGRHRRRTAPRPPSESTI
jgi:hypothetical protein